MGKRAIEAIDALEPYGGGKGDILWCLHSANNVDKHRLLPTIATRVVGHTILDESINRIADNLPADYPNADVLRGRIVMPKPGAASFDDYGARLTVPITQNQKEFDLSLDIAFGEPKVLRGKHVLNSISNMHDAVEAIILDFHLKGLL